MVLPVSAGGGDGIFGLVTGTGHFAPHSKINENEILF